MSTTNGKGRPKIASVLFHHDGRRCSRPAIRSPSPSRRNRPVRQRGQGVRRRALQARNSCAGAQFGCAIHTLPRPQFRRTTTRPPCSPPTTAARITRPPLRSPSAPDSSKGCRPRLLGRPRRCDLPRPRRPVRRRRARRAATRRVRDGRRDRHLRRPQAGAEDIDGGRRRRRRRRRGGPAERGRHRRDHLRPATSAPAGDELFEFVVCTRGGMVTLIDVPAYLASTSRFPVSAAFPAMITLPDGRARRVRRRRRRRPGGDLAGRRRSCHRVGRRRRQPRRDLWQRRHPADRHRPRGRGRRRRRLRSSPSSEPALTLGINGMEARDDDKTLVNTTNDGRAQPAASARPSTAAAATTACTRRAAGGPERRGPSRATTPTTSPPRPVATGRGRRRRRRDNGDAEYGDGAITLLFERDRPRRPGMNESIPTAVVEEMLCPTGRRRHRPGARSGCGGRRHAHAHRGSTSPTSASPPPPASRPASSSRTAGAFPIQPRAVPAVGVQHYGRDLYNRRPPIQTAVASGADTDAVLGKGDTITYGRRSTGYSAGEALDAAKLAAFALRSADKTDLDLASFKRRGGERDAAHLHAGATLRGDARPSPAALELTGPAPRAGARALGGRPSGTAADNCVEPRVRPCRWSPTTPTTAMPSSPATR